MIRVSRSVFICLCLALAACSVKVASEEATCKNDLDCKGDRICSDGNCVTPDTVGATKIRNPGLSTNTGTGKDHHVICTMNKVPKLAKFCFCHR